MELSEEIEELSLRKVNLMVLEVEEVKGKLEKREKLRGFLGLLRENIDDEERVRRLEERVRGLEENWRESYGGWKEGMEREMKGVGEEFRRVWEGYRKVAKKVWM